MIPALDPDLESDCQLFCDSGYSKKRNRNTSNLYPTRDATVKGKNERTKQTE